MSISQIAAISILGIGGYYGYKYINQQIILNNQPNYLQPGATINQIIQGTNPISDLPKNTTIIPIPASEVSSYSQEESLWIADYIKSHYPSDPANNHFQTISIDKTRADQMFADYKSQQAAAAKADTAIKTSQNIFADHKLTSDWNDQGFKYQ